MRHTKAAIAVRDDIMAMTAVVAFVIVSGTLRMFRTW